MKKLSNIIFESDDDTLQYSPGDSVWIKTSAMEFHNRGRIVDEIDLSDYADTLDDEWKQCDYHGYITVVTTNGKTEVLVLHSHDIKKKR